LPADRLDVVAVWVPDEAAVVVGAVLGEDAGLVQDLGADRDRGVVKGPDLGSVGGDEGRWSSRSSVRWAGESQNQKRRPSPKPTARSTSTGVKPSGARTVA